MPKLKDCLVKSGVQKEVQGYILEQKQKLMDGGMDEADASRKAITDLQQETLNSLKDIHSQASGVKEGEPPTPKEPIKVTTGDGETIGITHADMDAVANELGLPTYQKDPQTEQQWVAEADKRLANGEMLPLIRKMESDPNYQAGPVETTMAKRYIASLKARINENPTQELLKELDRAKNAFNISGRVWGQTGRARQGTIQVQDTLADYLLDRGNDKGHPLTEEQIKEETEKYNKLKEANDNLQKELAIEKEKYAKLAAEQGVNKAKAAAKKAAKKSHEEYKKEREDAVKAAREALKVIRNRAQLTVPIVGELVAIAPHVKKVVQSLINEGVDKIDTILTDVHAMFKDSVDGISENDIRDIFIGVYDGVKKTKAELNASLRLFQRELDLTNKFRETQKKLKEEKSRSKQSDLRRKLLDLQKQIDQTRSLNKEVDTDGLDEKAQKRLEDKIFKLQNKLDSGDYDPEKKDEVKFAKSKKTQDLEDIVIDLENQIHQERIKDRMAQRTKTEKWYDFINREILGVRRLTNTILDLSVWLRQTVRLAFNPRKWDVFAKEVAKSWKATWSQTKFDRYMSEIHKDPQFDEMTKDGIRFNEFETNEVAKENEFYYKNWVFKVPYLRQLPLASQRAADAALNTARYELYKKYRRNLENQGITRESDPKVYQDMAGEVMNQTGSGKLWKGFENNQTAQKILGNTLYGARLMAANFNQLNPAYYTKMSPEVRKLIWKDIASYTVTTMAFGAAAIFLLGAKVSFDPEDPDFLQIRIGDKVYDITGGKVGYIRTALRILNAARVTAKKAAGGDVSNNEVKKKWEFAAKSTGNFFRNKLAPNTGYAYTWTFGNGKNTLGQDANPLEVFQLYPMYFDDAYEGFMDDGVISLATVLAPNLVGIGYNSYFSDPSLKPLDDLLQRNMQSDEMDLTKYRNFNRGGKELTKDEKERFIKSRDNYIGERLTKFFERGLPVIEDGKTVIKSFQDLSKDQIISETSKIKSAATRAVKQQLLGEEEETEEEIENKDKVDEAYETLYKEYYEERN